MDLSAVVFTNKVRSAFPNELFSADIIIPHGVDFSHFRSWKFNEKQSVLFSK